MHPFQVEIDSQLKVQQQLIRLSQLSKQFTQVESQIRVLMIGINILSLGIDNQQHRWKEQSQLKQ